MNNDEFWGRVGKALAEGRLDLTDLQQIRDRVITGDVTKFPDPAYRRTMALLSPVLQKLGGSNLRSDEVFSRITQEAINEVLNQLSMETRGR